MLDYVTPAERSSSGQTGDTARTATRVSVVVVTGYLGSGKTTLIAELVRRPDMAGTAVIVNELAEAGIDQAIIADAGAGDVVLLANGCLCCAGGSDLRNAAARLIATAGAAGRPLGRILIETSGAADPGPILRQLCFDPVLRSRLRYGGVLALFDAANGRAMLALDAVGFNQIGLADTILVTKTDLVDAATTAAVGDFLRSLNPSAHVTVRAEDAHGFVAGTGREGSGTLAWLGPAVEAETSGHRPVLGNWSVYARMPVRWHLAEQAIRIAFDRHGDDVLRTKGLVWTDDDPRPLVIHGIGRHFHRPVRLRGWEGEPMTRLVVIGFAGAEAVAASIATAISGHVGPQPNNKTSKYGGI
ncbi:MAG: GTP-binding protein [Ancalomicrobiaceae bacterium]|nr:GTP-binding protein [Ancalomicrobiaceae bacterium]